jgi:ER-bound oxygenase mpaB/B'/Rubber oxygenase, catalytic domain
MQRFKRHQDLQRLDPKRDNCEICRQLTGYEFPWDITRALELALFRTFCVPSIARTLDRTAEFHQRAQKRYDDTGLMVSILFKQGHDTPEGQAVIERMNQIHGHFAIANEDFLYILSTFIYEPIRWIERFGWRKLTPIEQEAIYYFWVAIGEQMHIHTIPGTYNDFEQFNRAYEQTHFQYHEANQRLGASTIALFLSWFPAPLRPTIKPFVYGMMDDAMITAFDFPPPQPWQRQWASQLLRVRGKLLRYVPPRQTTDFYVDQKQLSYPHGRDLSDLGPPKLLTKLNARRNKKPLG